MHFKACISDKFAFTNVFQLSPTYLVMSIQYIQTTSPNTNPAIPIL